jgi:spermidine/putrescine transport system substrate-binding protein
MRDMKTWLALLLFGSVHFFSGLGADETLNVLFYSEYIDPAILKDFEARFKCKVVMDLFDEPESMLAKVQAGGKGLYDLTVATDYQIKAMIGLGLLAPLNHQRLQNLKNIEDEFLRLPYDPANQFTVPYQWGTVGVLARPEKNKPLPRSWGIFFDPARQLRPFLLIDSVRDTLGAALRFQGHSVNSVDVSHLRAARDLVLKARKDSAGFESSVGGKGRVLAKTARAAIVYSGEGARAMLEDPELVYFIPEEGSELWIDNLCILKDAPHRTLAEDFINFMLDGDVGARVSNFTRFNTPNKASKPKIKPELINNPALYPSREMRAKLELAQDLGSKARLYDEVWTQIKSGAK